MTFQPCECFWKCVSPTTVNIGFQISQKSYWIFLKKLNLLFQNLTHVSHTKENMMCNDFQLCCKRINAGEIISLELINELNQVPENLHYLSRAHLALVSSLTFYSFVLERLRTGLKVTSKQKKVSCSVMSNSLGPHGPHGLYSPWNSPDQNSGVGSCSLLQGIFPTQGLSHITDGFFTSWATREAKEYWRG